MFFGYIALIYFDEIRYIGVNFSVSSFFASVLIFILVAITEEVLIRGYVLNSLMQSVNNNLALIMSSIIFSFMHLANPNYSWFSAIELFISGIFLGISYTYTKNLIFPIALHFSWNFFQGTVFGFNVSGLHGYSIIEQTRISNTIWNGGDFGFEGSILAIIFQIIFVLVVIRYFKNKKIN